MSTNFLGLTNRILKAFNEVQLDSSTFSSATGFYAEAQDAINQAIFDICSYEDTEWPFLWSSTTLNTVTGQTDYTRSDTFTGINWESFRIERAIPAVLSITANLTTGIATVSTVNPHLFITGDIIQIFGASDTGYNTSGAITVTSPTTFTIKTSATSSPASGSLLVLSDTVLQTKLQIAAWDQYINAKYWDTDQNTNPDGYSLPKFVVRKPDNNIYIGPPCDRVYTIYYEGFTLPDALVNYNDSSVIPTQFEQVIIDKALHYAYMFRDNAEEAQIAEQRFQSRVVQMRRILIPQETYATATD